MSTCDPSWNEAISAFCDGEASPEEAARVAAHLERCEPCARAARVMRGLGDALRASAPRAVPDHVVARARRLERRSPRRRWATIAAAALAAAACVSLFAARHGRPELDQALASELVTNHLRGFAREQPCDFSSSDPGAVSAWIEQGLGYSVEVPSLPDAQLIGARHCHLGGTKVAAILYRCGDAPVTIFAPPPESQVAEETARFCGDELRCTEGPLGERICSAPGGHRVLVAAVESHPEQLASALSSESP
jgi:anti-sigma factor RsiW